jgi:CheY-like chemotaxis protein
VHRDDPVNETAVASAPQVTFARQRVLVVDDNRDTVDWTVLLLRELGQTVEKVYDGESAIHAAEAFHPHIVLLDLDMPGMNGFEVARRLRQMPGARIRIIAHTGFGRSEYRTATADAGFDDVLTKPVPLSAWVRVLG